MYLKMHYYTKVYDAFFSCFHYYVSKNALLDVLFSHFRSHIYILYTILYYIIYNNGLCISCIIIQLSRTHAYSFCRIFFFYLLGGVVEKSLPQTQELPPKKTCKFKNF